MLQGCKRGREEGLDEARKLGLDEGRRAERERIARSLLDVIIDDAILAEKTGLSLEPIQRLRGAE